MSKPDPTLNLVDALHRISMARTWFEGNPEGALDEIAAICGAALSAVPALVQPEPTAEPLLSDEDRELLDSVEHALNREWNGLAIHRFQRLREKLEAASPSASQPEPSADLTMKCLPNGVLFDAFGRERVRYVRVTLDGTHLILHPNELEAWKADEEDPNQFTYTDVYLSPEEADALPEFDGF